MKYQFHRVVALALGLTLVAGSALAVPADRQEKEEKASVPGQGKVALTVKNARGRTVVVGRPEASTITIVAMKTSVGRDTEEAKAMLDRIKMEVSETGDEVRIETRDGNKYEDWGWSVMNVEGQPSHGMDRLYDRGAGELPRFCIDLERRSPHLEHQRPRRRGRDQRGSRSARGGRRSPHQHDQR